VLIAVDVGQCTTNEIARYGLLIHRLTILKGLRSSGLGDVGGAVQMMRVDCGVFDAGHATSVVFDLDEKHGGMLDEVYHSTWFNESRRLESVKAHTALGGRLVHGCQSVPNMSGGACVPYGASIARFRDDLGQFRDQWVSAIYACRAAQ
jgi:hypothetical protein